MTSLSPTGQNLVVVKVVREVGFPVQVVCIDRCVWISEATGIEQNVVDFSPKKKIVSNYWR